VVYSLISALLSPINLPADCSLAWMGYILYEYFPIDKRLGFLISLLLFQQCCYEHP
jgi:hypothetical protein